MCCTVVLRTASIGPSEGSAGCLDARHRALRSIPGRSSCHELGLRSTWRRSLTGDRSPSHTSATLLLAVLQSDDIRHCLCLFPRSMNSPYLQSLRKSSLVLLFRPYRDCGYHTPITMDSLPYTAPQALEPVALHPHVEAALHNTSRSGIYRRNVMDVVNSAGLFGRSRACRDSRRGPARPPYPISGLCCLRLRPSDL